MVDQVLNYRARLRPTQLDDCRACQQVAPFDGLE